MRSTQATLAQGGKTTTAFDKHCQTAEEKALERFKFHGRNKPIWPARFATDSEECALAFVLNCQTWDENAKKIRDFPDKQYLRQFIHDWYECRKARKSLIIQKCRRMVISWCCRCLELWQMGLERSNLMLGGDDYEAAAKHCWRLKHLYVNLQERFPEWKLPDHVQSVYKGEWLSTFSLSNGSTTQIINAKSESIQGEGCAIATFEEFGLYDNPASVIAQAKIVTMGDDGEGGSSAGFVCCITNAQIAPKWKAFKAIKEGEEPLVEVFPGYSKRHMESGDLFVEMQWFANESWGPQWLEGVRRAMSKTPFEFRLQILMIDEGEGSFLWNWDLIDQFRLSEIPSTANIVKVAIAIDPSVKDPAKKKDPNKEPDECGMIVGCLSDTNHAYIMADLSGVMSPAVWAQKATKCAAFFEADEIIYESNQGKDLIPEVIKGYSNKVKLREVTASVGKRPRAEPAVVQYEMGNVHHIGHLTALEKELCGWDSTNPGALSPGRLDALVWLLHGFGLCKHVEAAMIDRFIDSVAGMVL